MSRGAARAHAGARPARELQRRRVRDRGDAAGAVHQLFRTNLRRPDLDEQLWDAFRDALPHVLAYALSFFIIGRTGWRITGCSGSSGGSTAVSWPSISWSLRSWRCFRSRRRCSGNYPTERPALIVYAASHQCVEPRVRGTVVVRDADNRLIDPSTPRNVVSCTRTCGTEHPDRLSHVDPGLVHRRQAAQLWWLLVIPLRTYFTRRYGKITDIWLSVSSSRRAG